MSNFNNRFVRFALAIMAISTQSQVDAKTSCCKKTNRSTPCSADAGSRHRSDWASNRNRASLDSMVTEMLNIPLALDTLMKQNNHQYKLPTHSKYLNYDIIEDEGMMELSMDLPGVRMEDVTVELQEGGQSIKISGSRKYAAHTASTRPAQTFEQSFAVDDSIIEVDSISVIISDGVLVLTAPKIKRKTPTVRRIPVGVLAKVVDNANTGSTSRGAIEEHKAVDMTNQNKKPALAVKADNELEISDEEDIEQ
uniref:SHSP domain-containing protein n=1 Tax=Chaetoceros debilis TaxID=122233 RepID=A0A7S3Q1D2_9STRA